MQIVDKKITLDELKKMSERTLGSLVKAVVDIEKEIMVVDAEFHSDEENLLLKNNSKQTDLWGIIMYPTKTVDDWIEFDSIINIRPTFGNKSRGVDDREKQEKIKGIVNKLVVR